MTKYEFMYAHALQGLCANPNILNGDTDPAAVSELAKQMANMAVEATMSSIERLEREQRERNHKKALATLATGPLYRGGNA